MDFQFFIIDSHWKNSYIPLVLNKIKKHFNLNKIYKTASGHDVNLFFDLTPSFSLKIINMFNLNIINLFKSDLHNAVSYLVSQFKNFLLANILFFPTFPFIFKIDEEIMFYKCLLICHEELLKMMSYFYISCNVC